jgi:tRNA threonylcarbamoyladenosine biosynthesis protein TsaE
MERKKLNLSEFQKEVVGFFKKTNEGDLILLSGPMGSGKTELVKAIAKEFDCRAVASPTFAFHHHYKGKRNFQHWDLYRVENTDELESTGFWELIQSKETFFIEWPEKLKVTWLPPDQNIFEVTIEIENETQRNLKIVKLDLNI